jgi:hypothetical protein
LSREIIAVKVGKSHLGVLDEEVSSVQERHNDVADFNLRALISVIAFGGLQLEPLRRLVPQLVFVPLCFFSLEIKIVIFPLVNARYQYEAVCHQTYGAYDCQHAAQRRRLRIHATVVEFGLILAN